MSYKITIQQIEKVTEKKNGEYGVLDKRPWTDEEIKNQSNLYERENFLKANPLKAVYGYLNPYDVIVEKDVKIFEQVVEDINLTKVISAINNL